MAEQICRDTLPDYLVNHSFRTWLFATALMKHDGHYLDRRGQETMLVACLLHDIGLSEPTTSVCFTKRGVQATQDNKVALESDGKRLEKAAEAIARHVTPRLRVRNDGLYSVYLQRGSLLDLTGIRAAALTPEYVCHVFRCWPSLDSNRHVADAWDKEAKNVPHGRAALLKRWTFLSQLIRRSPLPRPDGVSPTE